jgi:hypothetical protein
MRLRQRHGFRAMADQRPAFFLVLRSSAPR